MERYSRRDVLDCPHTRIRSRSVLRSSVVFAILIDSFVSDRHLKILSVDPPGTTTVI